MTQIKNRDAYKTAQLFAAGGYEIIAKLYLSKAYER